MTSMRILLVIGDDHEKICKEYRRDKDHEVPVMVLEKDAAESRQRYIKYIEEILSNKGLSESVRNSYTKILDYVKGCSDEEYFEFINDGNRIENGVAYSKNDPKGLYCAPRCGQVNLDNGDGELEFSNPFILLDGSKAYVARKGDIDWSEMHLKNTHFYERVWEVCVNGAKPQDKSEERAYDMMKNRKAYFKKFKDSDEYVRHCTSFWAYLVATADRCDTLDGHKEGDKSWVSNFYDTYIEPLSDDTLLSIYEVKLLDSEEFDH